MSLNVEKTEFVDFSVKKPVNSLKLCNHNICNCPSIKRVEYYKYLGCIIDEKLDYNLQIEQTKNKIRNSIKALNVCVSPLFKKTVYSAFLTSFLNYALSIWGNKDINCLIDFQKYILEKFKIENVLLIDKLYSYERITLARKNKLCLDLLDKKEMEISFNTCMLSDGKFANLFLQIKA